MPYQPFRIDRLNELAAFSAQAGLPKSHPTLPAVSICSGRAYPYVEAMSQLLHVQTPVLFEAGAGMFDPVSALTTWHPNFTESIRLEIDELRHYMEQMVSRKADLSIDYAKRSQAAMVGVPNGSLDDARDELERFVATHHPGFIVFHTHISIDIVPSGLTKAEGMVWLAQTCGVDLEEMAFVGDTGGDVGALKTVGASFSPANGTPDARAAAHHASDLFDIDAVLEAYNAVSSGS